jgi:SAM-dependent methyltransferase
VWLEFATAQWDPEASRAQAAWLSELLQLPAGGRVLDVPCGYGRHALEMASRSYQVTGVDLVQALLDKGRSEALGRGLQVSWECRDMRDLPWPGAFDGAYCFFGSFGYFDEAGNLAFLKAVARCLKPGARFLVETHVAETLLARFQPRGFERVAAGVMLDERAYDPVTGRVLSDWTFLKDGRERKGSSSIRIYTYRELCGLLAEAGFGASEGYDTSTRKPFTLGASRLVLVAERRRDA